jgi:integrase
MRREVVANLEWPDVRFKEGLLIAHKTKTKKGRPVPLNAKLETLLLAIPPSQRSGYVVKMPEGVDRLLRMDNITRKIQKEKRKALLNEWSIPRPPPSRSKDYSEKKKAFESAKKKRAATIKTALDRIGWNAFRHTFGSLLAQGGVSLDKISSWMGNTPDVCRRHYAQFIPRDRRDDEIDKL